MRWPLAMFGSRVARRMFARFALASFLPLGALAALFLIQAGRTLERRGAEELETTTRTVGHVVLDKLLAASELLATVPDLPDSASLAAFGIDAASHRANGVVRSFGAAFEPPALPPGLQPGTPALWTVDDGSSVTVYIAQAAAGGTIVGRVDPIFLETAAELVIRATEVCVFPESLAAAPLFCTVPLPEAARSVLASADGPSVTTWSEDGETWLAAEWQLFIPSRFEGEPWNIVVATPRSLMLDPLATFNGIAPQTLVLALLVIGWLSIAHIRSTLNPLNNLVAATKRIAAQEFATRVAVIGNDEFTALGDAMNDMALRLGRQFTTLTTLANIDRLILTSESIEGVVDALLHGANGDLPGFEIAVLLTNQDDQRRGRWYRYTADAPPAVTVAEISEREHASLLAAPQGILLRMTDGRDTSSLADQLGSKAFAVPILRDRSLAGALFATLRDDTSWDAHDLAPLRELAGRLAVALTSAEREQALIQRAHFDPLTGMPNRRLCHDRLQHALAQAHRDNQLVALLFIDIDEFKNINDSLGHVAGDDLLRETALRLSAAVRDADTVGRFGGDEYLVILPALQNTLEIQPVLDRVMAALQRPFQLNGRESFITGSIGVTVFPEDGSSADELLRRADTAMYSAKAAGRARCVYFAKEMDLRVQERVALGNDLRRACDRHELFLVYQPQIRLAGHDVVSVEALLRWRHPTRGLVPPAVFVPLLEESGLIETVGAWVLQTALRDLAAWRSAGLPIMRVGVNVAARQLLAPGFVDIVTGSLRAAGLGERSLELELTETTLIGDLRAANARLAELTAHGVRIAVDDFGTGYSSLGYLNELTFDALKIDRAFVVNLPNEKSVAIVKAIVAVAHALGKEVVAEGVEDELQRVQLAHLGCDLAQGYLFSEPLEAPALARWLERWTARQPRSAA
jgi:diguanylate cyclase (GGDEF)-like protein